MKDFIRDSRSPIPKSVSTSIVMRGNKAKNTKPEILLRRSLWSNGLKGYRLNFKKIPGKPDIVFISRKIAIFVNGCFWHRCPKCKLQLPKSNQLFWSNKFQKNKLRDKQKSKELEELGWNVIVIWECEIKKDIKNQIDKIRKIIK